MYNYTINLKLDSREISIRTMALPKGILDELNLNTMEAKGESFFKNNYKFDKGFEGRFTIHALRRATRANVGAGLTIGARVVGGLLGPLGYAAAHLLTMNAVDPTSHYAWLIHFDNSNSNNLEYLLIEYGRDGVVFKAFVKDQKMTLYEVSKFMMGIVFIIHYNFVIRIFSIFSKVIRMKIYLYITHCRCPNTIKNLKI